MRQQENQLLRRQGLVFFGKIVAGQAHEITNVLNVINELAGLQADVLAAVGRERTCNVERLIQVAERIRNQVQRGEALVRSMSRFAHSVDEPVSIFDLKEALEQVVCLAQRPANLAKTALSQEFPARSAVLEASPFSFKQAVLTCIEIALTASSDSRRITVSYRVFDTRIEVAVASADPMTQTPNVLERQAHLALLMRELGGDVSAMSTSEEGHCITIQLPKAGKGARDDDVAIDEHGAEDNHAS
ncbi:MAG: hypothetical protein ABII12_13190 [Planctomycetota bacterium]